MVVLCDIHYDCCHGNRSYNNRTHNNTILIVKIIIVEQRKRQEVEGCVLTYVTIIIVVMVTGISTRDQGQVLVYHLLL